VRPRREKSLVVWLIDPIDYSGLAYYDAGLAASLAAAGADVTVLGSDRPLLTDPAAGWHRRSMFRGASGTASRVRKGWNYLFGLMRLLGLARRSRPDIVHWQYLELPILDLVAMLALRWLGLRQVYTAHELEPWVQRGYHRILFHRLYRTVDLVVVHGSRAAGALTTRWRIPPARVLVTGHGDYRRFAAPDLPQAVARERLGLPERVPIALFFGSARPSKGLPVLLQAWPRVVRDLPAARLVVAARPYKGVDLAGMAAAIRSTSLGESVDFRIGEVDPVAANDFYRGTDVVALPYDDITTSGVLRYAYSSARPVVATAVGEHLDLVTPDIGWLVAPRDAPALAATLIAALGDREVAAEMGRRAEGFSRANFDWDAIGRATLEGYRSVMKLVGGEGG
jgi:glycosyltransferase involved in cell wall biosynthesis